MSFITTRFEEVKAYRTKKGKCSVCGKSVTRSRTFTHTINPWNKNSDGTIKNYSQVLKDVNKEADKWEPNFTHDKCRK